MIITKIFPPEPAVGVHRTVGLCRHLIQRGWDVTVVTSRMADEGGADNDLLALVPNEVRVIRTPAPDLPVIAAKILKRGSAKKPAQPWSPSMRSQKPLLPKASNQKA